MQTEPLTNPGSDPLIDTVGDTAGFHSERVLDWRQREFERLGFDKRDAAALAKSRIDIHEMNKLLKAGCAPELAWRILTGTMWSGHDPLWDEKALGGYSYLAEDVEESETLETVGA